MKMISLNLSNNLLILLIFILNLIELNASQEITVTCGSNQNRRSPMYPERRGPKGEIGAPGPQGIRGIKGDPGQCPNVCDASLDRISRLEENFHALTKCLHRCINGKCVNENNTYVCLCSSGYTGINCTDDSCDNPPCPDNSHCTGPNQCTCDEGYLLNKGQCTEIFSCNDVFRAGHTISGVYNITVPGRSNQDQVYCDLNTDGGNWLVFQRRINGSVDFYRNWTEYQNGFGNLNGEFWLGLDLLNAISESRSFQLRVDLEDWDGNTAYAEFRHFSVGNSESNYQLNVSGYNGTAGDSLKVHNNQQFSTKEQDNDEASYSCAQARRGAWWYGSCGRSNLNGEYLRNGAIRNKGIGWVSWKNNFYSMKRAEMKIKPN